jgi:hypothetical protein
MTAAEFRRRITHAMHAVARESGHVSAYPDTPAGRRAAPRQPLRTIDDFPAWGNDYQRSLVLAALRRLREEA